MQLSSSELIYGVMNLMSHRFPTPTWSMFLLVVISSDSNMRKNISQNDTKVHTLSVDVV